MLSYSLLKNHAGVLLTGDYDSLRALHEVVHQVNEKSPILKNKEGAFLALAYEVRKAYEQQRKLSSRQRISQKSVHDSAWSSFGRNCLCKAGCCGCQCLSLQRQAGSRHSLITLRPSSSLVFRLTSLVNMMFFRSAGCGSILRIHGRRRNWAVVVPYLIHGQRAIGVSASQGCWQVLIPCIPPRIRSGRAAAIPRCFLPKSLTRGLRTIDGVLGVSRQYSPTRGRPRRRLRST